MSGHFHGGHSHSPGHGVGVEEGFVPRPLGEDVPRPAPLDAGAGHGKIVYLDMVSGVAGDMLIAGFCDLGIPLSVISAAVECLDLPGVSLELRPGYVGAIGCHHFRVSWEEQGRERSYSEIKELISQSALDESVERLALDIFSRLALAEAEVHRTSPDDVHFHEVGAVDAIVDIVGAAAAIVYLGAEIKASPVPLGRGFVQCRHGSLPLPAPAALNCLKGVPTVPSGLQVELVTPTGAAIVATSVGEFSEWPSISIERVGFGAGTRGLPDRPNALRLILGEELPRRSEPNHALLEANIDDMTGELTAHAMALVLAEGALDVWVLPATMKKGRPGMIFCALCEKDRAGRIADIILQETSSLGVRQSLVSRLELPREIRVINTEWGEVRVKTSGTGPKNHKEKPEFDDCAEIARREGVPLRIVLAEVQRLCSGSKK